MEKETELVLLENVQKILDQKPDASQRELASAVNLSLGMTNALLRRFAEKGWLYIQKISARNVRYGLTPDGVNEIARRSYRYIRRTMKSIVSYRDIIVRLVVNAKLQGCQSVVIIGKSDIQFIVEYASTTHGMDSSINDTFPIENIVPNTLYFFTDTEAYADALTQIRDRYPDTDPSYLVNIMDLFSK
jgi:predicted transcriptional regulator